MRKNRKMRNRHIMLILSVIFLTIFNQSWREIPKYYKNMAFVSSFNIIYYFLCKRHLVWEFIPAGINWMLIRVVHTLFVSPLLVLVFLSKMPTTLSKQFVHFIKWILICTGIEYLIHKKRLILYAHGWNILWSGILFGKMFLYSHLFTNRPLLTLCLSMCSTLFFVLKFHAPLKRKHFSRFFSPFVDLYYHTFLEDLFARRKTL